MLSYGMFIEIVSQAQDAGVLSLLRLPQEPPMSG